MSGLSTSSAYVRKKVRDNLNFLARVHGYSEEAVDYVYRLLTSGDSDASEHRDLLEEFLRHNS